MRFTVTGVFGLLFLIAALFPMIAASSADKLQNSRNAVDRFLKENLSAECGSFPQCSGGLVARHEDCPKNAVLEEFVEDYQVVPIDSKSDAILIATSMCGGGNKSGQYLTISTDDNAELITSAGIGDMSFIARDMSVSDGIVYLHGAIWMPGDPHCCPSKEGTLEYNVKTGEHRFTGLKDSR